MIGNGHHIKFGRTSSETTGWDMSFEKEFDRADNNFPTLINWLESLERTAVIDADLRKRFVPRQATDEQINILIECAVSLAVRGPLNREASVSLAEQLRGPLPERERNSLIGANMYRSQRMIVDSIDCRGKFAVVYSPGPEFIFGDGFFHNVRVVTNPPFSPRIFVPITPLISVMVSRPASFATEPRISTLVLTEDEVEICNRTVQIYSRNAIFYRSHKPILVEEFQAGKHMEYSDFGNPIDSLFNSMPGVAVRSNVLGFPIF